MKVKFDIDATPEELRRFFGLPDIEPLQKEMLEKLREQLLSGNEELDLTKLMNPLLPEHLRSMESMQKAFWQAFSEDSEEKETKAD